CLARKEPDSMRLPCLVLALASASTLCGCGESGGGATFELGNANHAQPEDVARVYVTIDRVEAYVVDPVARRTKTDNRATPPPESGWRSVRLPVDRTFDLLQLGVDHTRALGDLDLAAGTISELRLVLDEEGDNRVVMKSGESCVLDLSRFP